MRWLGLVFSILTILSAGEATAADGDLDPDFGLPPWGRTDGTVPSDLRLRVLLGTDGNLYAASVEASTGEIYAARFPPSPLRGVYRYYGTSGRAYSGIERSPGSGVDIALQADGKALLAGVSAQTQRAFVARFDASGTLDPTFGVGGITYESVAVSSDYDVAVAVQPDGRVLLSSFDFGTNSVFLRRFTTAGVPQASSTTGIFASSDSGLDLAVQTDGKVLLGARDRLSTDGIVARFDTALALDSTFGGHGITSLDPLAAASNVEIAIDAQGRIVFAGLNQAQSRAFATRLNTDGTVDLGFGTGGVVSAVPSSSSTSGVGLDLRPQGNLILAGFDATATEIFVSHFDASGSLQMSFGTAGVAHFPATGALDFSVAVAASNDGTTFVGGGHDSRNFVGLLDEEGLAIGTGVAFVLYGSTVQAMPSEGFGLLAGVEGSLYVVERHYSNGWGVHEKYFVTGIMAPSSGAPIDLESHVNPGEFLLAGIDIASNQNFVQPIEYPGYPSGPPMFPGLLALDSSPVAVVSQADGKAVLAAYDAVANQSYLARFTSSASLDRTFGTGGIVHSGVPAFLGSGHALAIEADGDLLLAGVALSNNEGFVVRFDAAGILDASFGNGGVATTGIATAAGTRSPVDILALQDGSIVLAGHELATGGNFVLRLNPAGGIDVGFGTAGVARPGLISPYESKAPLAVQSDDRLILAGTDSNAERSYAARFLPDGALDSAFGEAGIARPNFTSWTISLSLGIDRIFLSGFGDPVGPFAASFLAPVATAAVGPSPSSWAEAVVYPNPFNPMTAVRFTMPRTGMAHIRVYDVRGRLVRDLLRENRSGGAHEVFWRGKDNFGREVASGTYALRLDLAGETVLRRVVLLK